MSDTEIRSQLNSLPLASLIFEQRRTGRMSLDHAFREFWNAQHGYASGLLVDRRRGSLVRKMAQLLSQVTNTIATLEFGTKPNYYQYTEARLLDWFLSPGLAKLPELQDRCLTGTYQLLHDLLAFESDSLGGFEKCAQEHLDRKAVHARVDLIRLAANELQAVATDSPVQDAPRYTTLEEYAAQPSRLSMMLHFSCMPLTQTHDEVLFIRTLHGSELCFFAIRICLTAAIELLKVKQYHSATKDLMRAASFGRILHKWLQILRTMPVEHFALFRDLTGKASALQSMNYHLMDSFLQGVTVEKATHFRQVEQLRPLLRYGHSQFISLKVALDRLDLKDRSIQPVVDAAKLLDTSLLTWRGLHLSFAKLYIPKGGNGTGGTSGADYLQKHLRNGLFSDTQPDWGTLNQIFPELEMPGSCHVRPGLSVSPGGNIACDT